MGLKRLFGDEFPHLPVKCPRHVENGDKFASFAENFPCDVSSQRANIQGKVQGHVAPVNYTDADLSILADEDFETSLPLSFVTSSSEEDNEFMATAYSPLPLEYSELNIPQRASVPFVDIWSSSLDRSPRRQVPIGPNHQAIVPIWLEETNRDRLDPPKTLTTNISSSFSLGFDNTIEDDKEKKAMGICVHDPNLSAPNVVKAGDRSIGCSCMDSGSVRCVREHVMEAREELRETLGQEKFRGLGFCDMGEAVACKWSKEEEQLYHEVVFSNPASLAKNFWKHLSLVLPARSKSELVSYYFNVFMLRRRAVQNRSKSMDIDSDDDEWHGDTYETGVADEDEDSVIESLFVQDDLVDHEGNFSEEGDCDDDNDNDEDDEDDEDGDDDGDTGADVGDGKEDATTPEDDGMIDYKSEAKVANSFNNCGSDGLLNHKENVPGSFVEDLDIQDNSCTSFEFQHNMAEYSSDPVDAGGSVKVGRVKNNQSKSFPSSDEVGHMYISEPCDSKVWEVRYPTCPPKGFDFLPTCNMIEEIFGLGTCNDKTRDYENIRQ